MSGAMTTGSDRVVEVLRGCGGQANRRAVLDHLADALGYREAATSHPSSVSLNHTRPPAPATRAVGVAEVLGRVEREVA